MHTGNTLQYPSFWSKWQKNLDNLASVQLDLLLDETNNCIRQLKSTFDNQQQVLRASLNNDTLNAKLVSTTVAEARPLAVGQPLTLHRETPIRLAVKRKEKIADLVQKDTKPPANNLKTP